MSEFSYQNELNNLIDSQQLVEVNVHNDDDRSTAYLMAVNDEYILFARVTNDATLGGVTICLTQDLESIQTETNFCKILAQNIDSDLLLKEARQYLELVKEVSFRGFVDAFKGTSMLVDIRTVENAYTGKIINYDESTLLLDELYIEESTPFSRTYLNPSEITSITVGSSWLKLISQKK